MTYSDLINHEPFHKIKTGRKTIELRLNYKGRDKIQVGDDFLFTDRETNETLLTRVVAIHKSADFETLIQSVGVRKCGCDNLTAQLEILSKFYTQEQVEKYGVLGIEIEPVREK